MIRFLVPVAHPLDALAAELAQRLLATGLGRTEECPPAELEQRLRSVGSGEVAVLADAFLATLQTPDWLAQLPALCESRLLCRRPARELGAGALPWAAAVDAVLGPPDARSDWPEQILAIPVADAAGRLDFPAFVAACGLGPAPLPRMAIQRLAECDLPTEFGEFRVVVYAVDGEESALLVRMGDLAGAAPLVRIHSECFTGEVLASLKCDCDAQLRNAMRTIAGQGRGAVVYLRQEGRGIGLANKIAAYSEQESGADTLEANRRLGFPIDARNFAAAALLLADHGATQVELLTNNPAKVRALRRHGVQVTRVLPTLSEPNPHNVRYLQVKYESLGHVGLRAVVPRETPLDGTRSDLLVFDLDGVVNFGSEVPAGIVQLLARLRAAGHTLRFLTNDGFNSRGSRVAELRRAGLTLEYDELYTASYLAARWIPAGTPALVLAGPPAAEEFAHLSRGGARAQVVVVGDWFEYYDRNVLQQAFEALHRGAELVAIHRKPHWQKDGSRVIDVGFWVAGLEYCARRPATIVGKPAAFAYECVRRDAGFPPQRAVMISDEIDPDLHGARRLGWRTILFGRPSPTGVEPAATDYAALAALLLRSPSCASS